MAVQIIEWLTRHHPELEDLATRVKRRTAYDFALWPSHQQWSEVYNEAFRASSAPVHYDNGARYWPRLAAALGALEDAISLGVLEQEYKAAPKVLEQEHPESLHLTGMWSVMYLHSGRSCNFKFFPKSCAALDGFAANSCPANDGLLASQRFILAQRSLGTRAQRTNA